MGQDFPFPLSAVGNHKVFFRSVGPLSALKLSSCGWAGQEAMTTLFNATSALEDVDLTGCWGCGQVSVSAALVLNNPRLKRLSLANIYGLRDDSVETLARHAKHLETLDVRYTDTFPPGFPRCSDGPDKACN